MYTITHSSYSNPLIARRQSLFTRVPALVSALRQRGLEAVLWDLDGTLVDSEGSFQAQAFTQSIDMLSKFGSSVILGMPPDEDRMFAVDSHSLTTGKKILGSKMGDTCIQQDIPNLIGLYQQGKLKLDELVSKAFPLHEINQAIEISERGEALRNVIIYD